MTYTVFDRFCKFCGETTTWAFTGQKKILFDKPLSVLNKGNVYADFTMDSKKNTGVATLKDADKRIIGRTRIKEVHEIECINCGTREHR